MGDTYKVEQLKRMLEHELSEAGGYGARLRHYGKDTKVLTIDAGGLKALIKHYEEHDTNLENGDENDGV